MIDGLTFAAIVVGAFLLVFILTNTNFSNCSSENYGTVLGQLAPYAEQLNECLNECNKSDPSKRFLSEANINCGVYCESVITDMAQRGVPPNNYPVENNMTLCKNQCNIPGATENSKRKCLSMCYGHNEVAQWCKELWCPYSLFDKDTCMNHCISTWNTNNNQVSWKWDMSR